MHSGNLEKTGSLRKRTLSRGMSEDESLRHIIRDAEESRSDSRYGSLRRGQRQDSHSEDDLLSENIEEVELRASFEEVRALELQQEALLFQVDCLQDALQSTEEMLAETQRDNHRLITELEREREARRRSEEALASLRRELQSFREEGPHEPLQSRACSGPVWLRAPPEGSSVDGDTRSGGSSVDLDPGRLLQPKTLHVQKHEAPGADDYDESSGYEDAPSEFSPAPSTPDTQPDAALLDSEAEDGGPENSLAKSTDSCALS
ncbi:retinitis pigmentosa 1-like 1 protein [Puntigrus tetrazona]|uniref:retinitis pigmentosa 1-like 1 protein n=1 Tax=Puntigrus tetrazona TaxID=1606681 RepID=UPI001C8AFF37|nr:retinitis pigmentosa 1-like 1 protein [Puntigrus tetrazona]